MHTVRCTYCVPGAASSFFNKCTHVPTCAATAALRRGASSEACQVYGFSSGGSECSAALLLVLALTVLALAVDTQAGRCVARTKQVGASRIHGRLRRAAGRDVLKSKLLECRQRAVVERGGEGGAAGFGDLGVFEVELPEPLQPPSRQRRRNCRRRRRPEG